MPDFGTWLGWNPTGDLEEWYRQFDRADTVAFIIGHRGISLTLIRPGSTIPAQTFILAPAGRNNDSSENASDSGIAAKEQLLLVGLPDADLQRGDRFMYPTSAGRLNYEVIRVERAVHGMVQGFAEEVQ